MGFIQGGIGVVSGMPFTNQRKQRKVLTAQEAQTKTVFSTKSGLVPLSFGRDSIQIRHADDEASLLADDHFTSTRSPEWNGLPGMFQNPQAIPTDRHAAAQEFVDWLAIANELQNHGDAETEQPLAETVKKIAVQQFVDYLSQNDPETYAEFQKLHPSLPVNGMPAHSDGPEKLIGQMLEFVETLNTLRAVRNFLERCAAPDNPDKLPENTQKNLERHRNLVRNVLLNRLEADVLHSMYMHLQFKAEYQDYFRKKAEALGTLPPPYGFDEPMTRSRKNPEMAKFEEFLRYPRERSPEELDALLVNALEDLRQMRKQSLEGRLRQTETEMPLHVFKDYPVRPWEEGGNENQLKLEDAIPGIARMLAKGLKEPKKDTEGAKGLAAQAGERYWPADPMGETLIRDAESLTISAENPTGRPGMGCLEEPERGNPAYELGRGWKARPRITVRPGETVTLGAMQGPGVVGRIWVTFNDEDNFSKLGIIKGYFDGSPVPSFKCPIGSFFNNAWGQNGQISSLFNAVNPKLGLESYHLMPFRKDFRIELENAGSYPVNVYYSIDLERVPKLPPNAGYFNAQYRLTPPNKDGVRTVLDVKDQGRGHLKGFYASWRANEFNWWGEGLWLAFPGRRDKPPIRLGRPMFEEDGVKKALAAVNGGGATNVWPGTEDVVGGAYDFIDKTTGDTRSYTNPYTGLVHYPARGYKDPSRRFGFYRWFRPPIHFEDSLLLVNQILGVRHSDGMFAKRGDSVATTAIFYTSELPKQEPALPSRRELEQH